MAGNNKKRTAAPAKLRYYGGRYEEWQTNWGDYPLAQQILTILAPYSLFSLKTVPARITQVIEGIEPTGEDFVPKDTAYYETPGHLGELVNYEQRRGYSNVGDEEYQILKRRFNEAKSVVKPKLVKKHWSGGSMIKTVTDAGVDVLPVVSTIKSGLLLYNNPSWLNAADFWDIRIK